MSVIMTELLVIALLILLNGLLSMSEMALVSARRAHLRARAEDGEAGARTALELAQQPTRFLSTVQIGITAVSLLTGVFAGANVAAQVGGVLARVPFLAPYSAAIGLGVVVAGITFVSLVLGELVPKRIALANPERIATVVAGPLRTLSELTAPLVAVLTGATDFMVRLLRVRSRQDTGVTEEDIRLVLAEGVRAGIVHQPGREVVESLLDLRDRRIVALMTPRPRIAWLDIDDPPEVHLEVLRRAPHGHYPVCRDELDDVVGILALRDVLPALAAGERPELRSVLRPPLFVPEQAEAFRALELFKPGGSHVALVIDENGGVSGLLTPTDVLEALLGELAAPAGGGRDDAVRRPDGSWLLDGLMPIDELPKLFDGSEVDEKDWREVQTLGGLAMEQLGRVPRAGDTFAWHGLSFEVVDMDGRRVDSLLVRSGAADPDKPARGNAAGSSET
jgi:putative hemolysin